MNYVPNQSGKVLQEILACSSSDAVINSRWGRCPFPSGPSLALQHPNNYLESHFILLAKMIKHAVFQLILSHWIKFTVTV